MPGIQLHDYQRVVKDFIVEHEHCAAFLTMGLGKTAITLDALNTVVPQGHILVIAPLNIVKSTWFDEIEKWGFNIRTRSLIVDDNGKKLPQAERLKRFQEVFTDPPTMYFINQDLITQPAQPTSALVRGLTRTCAALDEIQSALMEIVDEQKKITQDELLDTFFERAIQNGEKPPTKKSVNAALKWLKDNKFVERKTYPCTQCKGKGGPCCKFGLIDQMPVIKVNGRKGLQWPFPTVIIDESQGFKNPSSNRFKHLAMVRPAISRLIELTGTPTPNGLLDLWSQIYLLDQGAALGRTMTEYKDRWFHPDRYVDNRPVSWVPRRGAEQQIYDRISHLVMSVENTSLKLPDLTINDVAIHLDSDEMSAYKKFKQDAVLELVTIDGGVASITAANAAVLTTKLTQFASGTIYTQPEKHIFETVHNRKVEYLDYILRNTSTPVIIAYRFVSDRIRLAKDLKALGHDTHIFDGGREMIRNWNAGKYPSMLLQPASSCHGLNLQDSGHTLVWYTLPVSLEHYQQTNARLHRQGQQHPVTIHRLITKGTYDQRLPDLLGKKKITQDDLIEAVRLEVGALDLRFTNDEDYWLSVRSEDVDNDFGFDPAQLL